MPQGTCPTEEFLGANFQQPSKFDRLKTQLLSVKVLKAKYSGNVKILGVETLPRTNVL
jgi:hypothetical protein